MANLKATTYHGINDLIGASREGHVKLGNNTEAYAYDDAGHVGVRLHATTIAVLYPDEITVRSGGWQTVTTKERLNQLMADYGYGVMQVRGQWFVRRLYEQLVPEVPFEEGMTLKRLY